MMTVPPRMRGIHARAHTHAQTLARNFARTYVRYIRQGVEIIKGAWRARGCPDDGHVNQDGRQAGGLPSLQQSFVIGHFILMISMHA